MKYMVATLGSSTAVFALEAEKAYNLTAIEPRIGNDLRAIIEAQFQPSTLRSLIDKASAVASESLIPALPLTHMGKIICLGLNYAEHAAEGGREVPKYPVFFMRSRTSLCPAQSAMILPKASNKFDYEAELLVIIGKGGRHIDETDALDHVFGYSCFNDGSIRDYQVKTPQWTPGKNFDRTGAVGPVVVSADELPAGARGLRISSRINGETLQDDNTENMIFSVAKAIAVLSEFSTLEPGDLIAMGTPSGVGFARKPARWMRDGERVEIEIEGIGVLSNPISAEV